MARRATALKELRQGPDKNGDTLLIAGPYEFLPYDDSEKKPDARTLPALAKAFDLLAYDAVCLAPEEAEALKSQHIEIPRDWVVLSEAPQSRIINVGGKTIGVLFFPMPEKIGETPPEKLMAKVSREARKLREQSDLVVGVSPWGLNAEEAFTKLKKSAVDILLGAGPGSGIFAKAAPYGETLWTRAYPKGKAINELELPAFPGGEKFLWELNANFKAIVLPLDDKISPDSEMDKLF